MSAGRTYILNSQMDKALKSFYDAQRFAFECGDSILAGRSLNNIGYLYYQEDMFDSAVVYLKKSVETFDLLQGRNSLNLKTLNNLGMAYDVSFQPDSARKVFQKGLDFSQEINDEKYTAIFKQNIALTHFRKGEYNEAIQLSLSALPTTVDSSDSLRIYNTLIKSYAKINKQDSSSFYIHFLEQRVSEITDIYTLRSMYRTLSDSYESQGNLEKSTYYNKLKVEMHEKKLFPVKVLSSMI